MKINHAILHILDFESAVNVISQRELDLVPYVSSSSCSGICVKRFLPVSRPSL